MEYMVRLVLPVIPMASSRSSSMTFPASVPAILTRKTVEAAAAAARCCRLENGPLTASTFERKRKNENIFRTFPRT